MAERVVLFVCIQNAGRSQMAEALFNARAEGRVIARSAGSRPAQEVHPEVVAVMKELDIDLSGVVPKSVHSDVTAGVDVVVTMGCGDECPLIPGARVIDWEIPDPSGREPEVVRSIRDDLGLRVEKLIGELVAS